MPTIPGLSFSVRYELISTPVLILTDASTLPAGAVGRFIVKLPDGYVRTGSFDTPDITGSGGAFSMNLRLASDGNVQCGTYEIIYEVKDTSDDITTFTRNFFFSYKPVELSIRDEFDVFTPDLKIFDDTVYQVGGFNNGAITRSWTVTSTPTGTLTGSGVSIDLEFNGEYYDANYNVSFSASLLYTHQTWSWLTVNERISKSYTTYAQTPPTVDEFVAEIASLKDQLEDAINKCREKGLIKADLEWAQVLYMHIIDKILTGQTDGIYQDLKDLLVVLNNYQIPAYTPTNQPIQPYNINAYSGGAVWGNITGTITNQTDLVNYINSVLTSYSFATTFGDGINTSYVINHGLNSNDVHVEVYEISIGRTVYVNADRVTANIVALDFAYPPTTNQYRVIITK